jgi:hypothetical protein
MCYHVLYKKIFSPLQVNNKPHEGDSEHAFFLGSMDCTVATTNLFEQQQEDKWREMGGGGRWRDRKWIVWGDRARYNSNRKVES